MNQTIFTQDGIFVNYAHVQRITPYTWSIVHNGVEKPVYGLFAEYSVPVPKSNEETEDKTENATALGFYSSEEEFQTVIDRLYGWLNEPNNTFCVFEMPMDGFTEAEKKYKGSLNE